MVGRDDALTHAGGQPADAGVVQLWVPERPVQVHQQSADVRADQRTGQGIREGRGHQQGARVETAMAVQQRLPPQERGGKFRGHVIAAVLA